MSGKKIVLLMCGLVASLAWFSFTRLAHGETGQLFEVLGALPRWHEDEAEPRDQRTERLRTIALAQTEAAEGDSAAIAFLVTVSFWESRLARHVHAGQCRPNECDRGRARGMPQVQLASGVPRELWDASEGLGYEATLASMRAAMFVYRQALKRCGRGVGRENRLFNFYARGKCDAYFESSHSRAHTFRRVQRELQ